MSITPDERLPLGGYTERKGKLMDARGETLFARTLYLQQGTTKVAVVSAEMLTIPESLRHEVARRLPADVHLFLAATHTHCAPDSQMLNDRMKLVIPGIATYKRRWLQWYATRIAGGVLQASSLTRQVGRLELDVAKVQASRARRGGLPPDGTRGSVSGLGLFFFGAHPTILGSEHNQTNGDWPALVNRIVGQDVLVLNGVIGDVSPVADGADETAKFADFRSRLFADVPEVRSAVQARLAFGTEPISLGKPQPHPDFARDYHVPDALADIAVKQFAPPTASLSVVAIGSLAIVGVPGEPTTEVGNQIRNAATRLGFSNVWVCSHVNGWIGYILAPSDYDRGGYEATLSFNGRETSQRVVDAATKALNLLALARH